MPEQPEMIDFAVSDDFLDFFHRQGLTPRMSPRYFNRLDDQYMTARLGGLQENVSMLGQEVERLRTEVARLRAVPKKEVPKTSVPQPKRGGVHV